jgi:hypothetical protein
MFKKKILPAHLPELLSLLSEMTGVMRERVLQKHFGLDSLHASMLEYGRFPRAHNLPQEGFGIQFGCLLWGPSDDISDMKRTLSPVTKTPNIWTRWKYACRSTKDD